MTVHGVTDRARLQERVPTLCFTVAGRESSAVADGLAAKNIGVRSGHMYSPRLMKRLGLMPAGVVRASLVHYNTLDEIARFGDALSENGHTLNASAQRPPLADLALPSLRPPRSSPGRVKSAVCRWRSRCVCRPAAARRRRRWMRPRSFMSARRWRSANATPIPSTSITVPAPGRRTHARAICRSTTSGPRRSRSSRRSTSGLSTMPRPRPGGSSSSARRGRSCRGSTSCAARGRPLRRNCGRCLGWMGGMGRIGPPPPLTRFRLPQALRRAIGETGSDNAGVWQSVRSSSGLLPGQRRSVGALRGLRPASF